MTISETVLEMHYHRPLMEYFRKTYGLGAGKMNFYKPVPQKEVFVGFDQAYAVSQLPQDAFIEALKKSAAENGYTLKSKFIAFFFQFKVVSELQKKSSITPKQITNNPHYRSKLDTRKKESTGFSQHELLYNLHKNADATVYYACPMLFDKNDLYQPDPQLDTLRLVNLNTCPSNFTDNSNHYLYFEKKDANPLWCSEPTQGASISVTQFVNSIISELKETSPEESSRKLQALLHHIKKLQSEIPQTNSEENYSNPYSLFSDSLIILRVDEAPPAPDRQVTTLKF